MRYIERNPFRSGATSSILNYRWSSHHRNGYGIGSRDELLSPHLIYQELGIDEASRQAANLVSFDSVESGEAISKINACWQSGTPL